MNEMTRVPERRSVWKAFDDFDSIIDSFWRPAGASRSAAESGLMPAVDVTETDDEYRVQAELPGVNKDDIDVSIQDGVLTLNAETHYQEKEEDKGRLIRQERRYGRFLRSMKLGNAIDVDAVKADYKNGILILTLPKAEQVRPKRIDVKVS